MDTGLDGRFLCDVVLQFVVTVVLFKLSFWLWDYWICSTRDATHPSPLPPGESGVPIFGDTLALIWNVSLLFIFFGIKPVFNFAFLYLVVD